jgi:hypothetical protein
LHEFLVGKSGERDTMIELTNKELEVLKMLSYPNRVIASRLKITEALLKRISTLYFIKSLIRRHGLALL